ncbi:MAG: PqqD family protein [Muribaculaceae bacterium]|nr:PqqD family protein [Muribaculaceae bacterium]MDE7190590.1 PqqD family protein [Muribaculaceae bacterium]
MKKINGMVLRHLGTEAVIVAESLEMIDFNRLVSLNDSAAYIWEMLPDSDFDIDTVTTLLTERYDVDKATAYADARELVEVWLQAGIIKDNQNNNDCQ